MLAYILIGLSTVLWIYSASRIGLHRRSSQRAWMWASAFFRPLPLLALVFLPCKRHPEPLPSRSAWCGPSVVRLRFEQPGPGYWRSSIPLFH